MVGEFALVDSKGKAARRHLDWVTTGEQVFDYETGINRRLSLKIKEMVSARKESNLQPTD